jgi:hypothetical protein
VEKGQGTAVRDTLAQQAAFQLMDSARMEGITIFARSLVANSTPLAEDTISGLSTIADTWIHALCVPSSRHMRLFPGIVLSRSTSACPFVSTT